MSSIACKHGVTLDELEKANPQIHNPNLIHPGDTINLPPGAKTPTGTGKNAAEIAREFLGWTEYKLQSSGRLDMDQWPPKNEDCANFVSGCLEKADLITHAQRSDGVVPLAAHLRRAGWKDTQLKDAKPGDVVCFDGPGGDYQHVELFNAWVNGRPQFIGSNNVLRDGTQEITTDNGSWAYHFHVLQR